MLLVASLFSGLVAEKREINNQAPANFILPEERAEIAYYRGLESNYLMATFSEELAGKKVPMESVFDLNLIDYIQNPNINTK